MQIAINLLIVSFVVVVVMQLYRCVVRMWRWHRVKKVGANYINFINDYFANLPPRESEFCRDCKHSEVSNNNGNLICLNERSRHFGETIDPKQDKRGFCGFERVEQINTEERSNAIHHNQTTAKILSDDL